jgi:hypothetical protein
MQQQHYRALLHLEFCLLASEELRLGKPSVVFIH